jgi:signal transduction histidine kinase
LGEELLFLKALSSDSLKPAPSEFYPFLIHCIQDLQGLRFREKDIRVEINGRSLKECRDSLVFSFEPYTMEVILQNVIGNAMKYGDHLQIGVAEIDGKVLIEVRDNGPGAEVEKLKSLLLVAGERREAESTHLGLKVSIHLLEKCGGRLLVWSQPGAGASFFIEVPKHAPRAH